MDAILVVKSLDLALALRKNKSHPLAADILVALYRHKATIVPFAGISGVNPLVKYFRIQVSDDERDALLAALRRLPGVDAAYIKPCSSPT